MKTSTARSSQAILLTGFPKCELAQRVLGRILVSEPDAEVHCIVPERFNAIAREWISALPGGADSRVRIWTGDVASLDMGLSGAEYRELGARINVIQHCAAVTYTAAPLAMAEAVNVGGAHEVLELARTMTKLERVVHWSTTGATWGHDGVVFEDDLIAPRANPLLGTRHRAEAAMRKASSSVPITILRPAMLVGDSQTGVLARLEGAHLLISGLLSAPRDVPVPRPARADALLHVVPIDYAVEAGLTIARAGQTIGRTFHIVDPTPPTLGEALATIAELVGKPPPLGALPGPLARALLRIPFADQLVHGQRALIDELGRRIVYSDANARPVLTRAGLSCPAFTSYVGKLVAHVERARQVGERISQPSFGSM